MSNKIIVVVVCLIFFFQQSYSQGKTDGLPITVKVSTSVNLTNGSVEFTGFSGSFDKEPGPVLIEIITPAGNTDKVSARADNETGMYFVKYTPVALGKYEVTAYAADKKQTATTSFEVSADVAIDETIKEFDKAKDKVLPSLEASLNEAIAPVAEAADIDKTKGEIQKAKQKIKEFDNSWSKLKEALDALKKLAKTYPDVKKLAAPQLGKLSSSLNQSTDILKQVEKDLGTSKTHSTDECDKLYKVSEACAAFSTVMNLATTSLLTVSKNIFIDKLWPKFAEVIVPKTFSKDDEFVFKQAGKTGITATEGLSNLKTKSFGAGMLGDFTQYVSDKLFKKYCAEYKGPVNGDYTLEFKKDGKTYLKYKITYAGTASVYCRKDKIGGTLPKLSGYIEGNATNMEFTDDVWAVEDRSVWEEIKYQRIPAPVVPATASEKDPGFGAVARAALPGSFYFPLEAQMVQGKIVVKLMPPRSEFTDAFANRTVMVVRAKEEPHNIDGATFNYPITTARFILTRTMRMDDKAPTVTLDVKTINGKSTIEKSFTRTESPDADTKVDFNLKLKLEIQD